MPYRRGRRRRFSGARPVVQSFKKVLNFAGTSRAAAALVDFVASTGTDSVAAGQTTVTDSAVPTGAEIRYIEWHLSVGNLVAINNFMTVAVQLVRSGQTRISPLLVGGNPQRNQVFHMDLFTIGKEQNTNRIFKFKVPKGFQRVREGDLWTLTITAGAVWTDACLCIYKFYR